MEDTQAQLVAERIARMADQLNSRMAAIEKELQHHRELEQEQITGIRANLDRLQKAVDDHEVRIRTATDGVTSFRVWSGLAAGGSSIFSIIAFIKSLLP